MTLIADFLLAAGAFSAALYCLVLANRIKRFTTLETGMGGAIALLSAQVDEMTQALEKARLSAVNSRASLDSQTQRAEAATTRLELMLAALHDNVETIDPELEREPSRARSIRRRSERAMIRAEG